jgi:hypothetical protein
MRTEQAQKQKGPPPGQAKTLALELGSAQEAWLQNGHASSNERTENPKRKWMVDVAIAKRVTDPIDTGTAIADNARQEPTHR